MIKEHSLAAYKNRPAVIREYAGGDKINIEIDDRRVIKVREKDFDFIHPGPVNDPRAVEDEAAALAEKADNGDSAARDAWELLESDGKAVTLKELAELCFGAFNPASAWAAYRLLCDRLYFSGTVEAVVPRKRADVQADEDKRQEKHREAGERSRFLDGLRARMKKPAGQGDAPPFADSRFIQDVEALALGKSAKSKTMKDMGLIETPEDAHALLLNTGFWTVSRNPHPARFNVLQDSAKAAIKAPPHEERRDLTRLVSLAIDNAWTNDPDDAISTEEAEGARILYVHVADIASSVSAEDLSEREARDRGVTLYIPEGNVWMLAEESVQLFGLGIRETSPALTFKMVLDELGEIIDTEIFPSWIKARRLSYQEADQLLDSVSGSAPAAPDADAGIAAILSGLNTLAERNMRRRGIAGAVNIELPETRIHLDQDIVRIEPIPPYRSSGIVRECMLLAGEAAARWAISRFTADAAQSLAFPFVCQEPGDLPADVLPDPAGSYQLRRCMRPRTVSIKPSPHWGLGLDAYTQVTSPLRRYTDLLAHIQLRAILRGEKPLPAEDVSARLAAAEAAVQAATQAERASRGHWTMVYLSDKKDSLWDAIVLEKKMNRWVLVIPALALETQVSLRGDVRPNDPVKLVLKSVNIPRCEAVFAEA